MVIRVNQFLNLVILVTRRVSLEVASSPQRIKTHLFDLDEAKRKPAAKQRHAVALGVSRSGPRLQHVAIPWLAYCGATSVSEWSG